MSHSQLTCSHTHTLTPCLLDSFAFFSLASFTLFFSQETTVVVASGWQAVHVCVCVWHGVRHLMGLLPCRDTAQRTPFTASGWGKRHNCLRDLPYIDRGFQCESHPLHASLSSPTFCHCDAYLLCVSSAVTPEGVRWRGDCVSILNPDYLTGFMGVQFKGKPSL